MWKVSFWLCFFAVFLYGMVRIARNTRKAGEVIEEEEIKIFRYGMSCLIGGGLVAIVIGGQIVVNCSETIARGFGLSETLIGLTICSIGTSLPELVTSVVAAKKNQAGMALGNVIGSNIFNIFAGRWTRIRDQPDCNEHEQFVRYCDIGNRQCIYYGSCMEKTTSDTGRWCEYACCLCSLYGLHLRQRSTVILDFTDHSLHSVKTIRRDLFFLTEFFQEKSICAPQISCGVRLSKRAAMTATMPFTIRESLSART